MKLTNNNSTANIAPPRNIGGGRENPFITGDNSPQSLKAVFLRPSFLRCPKFLGQLSIMTVLFGQSLGLVAPVSGILTPFNTVTNTVRSMRDGFTHSITGITA
ncbi:MAG: hypothetical protein WBI40_04855 [Methylococcaceae bacterium]